MELTSKQFNKLATKKDLKKLTQESKSDLKKLEDNMDKKFATKSDLKKELDKFAIRAFNTFASKDDLKEVRQDIVEEVGKKIDRVLTAVDSIVGTHQEIGAERAANIGAHDRIEEEITKTNKRVTIVEKKLEEVHASA